MGKENNKNYFLKKQKRTLVAIHLKAEKNESGIHICDIDTYTVLEKKKTLQRTI